jgi:septum formation protein
MKKLVLASQSRDRYLCFKRANIPVIVIPSHFDERSISLKDPLTQIQQIALQKAKIIKNLWLSDSKRNQESAIIIAADTMGLLDEDLLGKPENIEHTMEIFSKLVGRTHFVHTAVSILETDSEKKSSFISTTKVHFQFLSQNEINQFLQVNQDYLTRAAGYSILDHASILIDYIEGSFTNVIGLPMAKLRESLQTLGIHLLDYVKK